MSERKVLNKYYPPDFDPSKIPKLRLPRNRQYSIRIMAPFNMRCNTCGEYIYKGKKFNSRKETVEDEDYLGLKIFRFYIKCPRCVAEIAFKTDPQNTDYELEGGATRNFEAMRTAEMLAKKEIQEKEQEELNNPMKVLENRTKASQQEMEMIETLEELRELNSRHAKVDHESMVNLHRVYEEQLAKLQDEEDEKLIKDIFGKDSNDESIKRLQDDEDEGEDEPPVKKLSTSQKPTDFLTEGLSKNKESSSTNSEKIKKPAPWARSVGTSLTSKSALAGLVRRKQPTPGSATSTASSTPGGSTETPATSGNQSVTVAKGPSQNDKEGEKPTAAAVPVVNGTVGSATTTNSNATVAAKPMGLGLLGAYSDTDSDDST